MDARDADRRHWWLTWSTFGTWVPERARDGATPARLDGGHVVGPDAGRAYWDAQRARPDGARRAIREPPAWLTAHDAAIVLASFLDTAAHHGWALRAAAVMRNHVEIVVAVDGDPPPSSLVRDFKSYASRALNRDRDFAPGVRGKWWTRSARTQPLRAEGRIAAAVEYVRGRPDCLALHTSEAARVRTDGER